MGTISLGVDLAKCTCSVCEMDGTGRVVGRRDFKRDAFALYLAQWPPGTVVAMEAAAARITGHGVAWSTASFRA